MNNFIFLFFTQLSHKHFFALKTVNMKWFNCSDANNQTNFSLRASETSNCISQIKRKLI